MTHRICTLLPIVALMSACLPAPPEPPAPPPAPVVPGPAPDDVLNSPVEVEPEGVIIPG